MCHSSPSHLPGRLLGPVRGCQVPEVAELGQTGQEALQGGSGCGSGCGHQAAELFQAGYIGPGRDVGEVVRV